MTELAAVVRVVLVGLGIVYVVMVVTDLIGDIRNEIYWRRRNRDRDV